MISTGTKPIGRMPDLLVLPHPRPPIHGYMLLFTAANHECKQIGLTNAPLPSLLEGDKLVSGSRKGQSLNVVSASTEADAPRDYSERREPGRKVWAWRNRHSAHNVINPGRHLYASLACSDQLKSMLVTED